MNTAAHWLRATRSWSFPATLIPVLLGSFSAYWIGESFRPFLFVLTLIGTFTLHAAANMLNDVDDFRRQVDRRGTYGGSGMLKEDLIQPEVLRRTAWLFLAAGSLIGLLLALLAGQGVLWLGILGVLSVVTYTTWIRFKYRALGDLQIFLTFGVAVTVGAFYVQTGRFSLLPVALSFPVGLLTDAILHANNLRDIEDDRTAGIRTMAMDMGSERARCFYGFLVQGAYLAVMLLVLCRRAPWWSLLVVLSWPLARSNVLFVLAQGRKAREEFATIDGRTARANLAFGLLFAISFLLDRWI